MRPCLCPVGLDYHATQRLQAGKDYMAETKTITKEMQSIAKYVHRMARKGTGCYIQYAGCPCNSCFHTWAEDELGLPSKLSHALWLLVLWGRGDYEPKDLTDAIEEL